MEKFSKIRDESSLTELGDVLQLTKTRVVQNKFQFHELGSILELNKSYEEKITKLEADDRNNNSQKNKKVECLSSLDKISRQKKTDLAICLFFPHENVEWPTRSLSMQ